MNNRQVYDPFRLNAHIQKWIQQIVKLQKCNSKSVQFGEKLTVDNDRSISWLRTSIILHDLNTRQKLSMMRRPTIKLPTIGFKSQKETLETMNQMISLVPPHLDDLLHSNSRYTDYRLQCHGCSWDNHYPCRYQNGEYAWYIQRLVEVIRNGNSQ